VAQLGEVLGGMLTDVVQARMAADAVTAQALATYRADPVLASMSVPRVTISTLTVKLNFAVSGVATPEAGPVPVEVAGAQWASVMRERVVPLVQASAPTRTARSRGAGSRATAEPPGPAPIEVPPEAIAELAQGRVDPVVAATVERLVKLAGGEIAPELQERLASEVRREAVLLADSLRQRILAERALHSRLEVDIVADAVANTKPEALQSLEVTFSVEDIEHFLTSGTE
jgi:hypothetical protein